MTKNKIIGLVIASVSLILLIVLSIFISTTFGKKEVNKEQPDMNVKNEYEREGIEIYSVSEYVVEGFTVKNRNDEYTIRKNKNGKVYIEGRENVPLLEESSANLYKSINSIKNESTVELGSTHPEVYGLDNPLATITVYKQRGVPDILYIGNKTSDGGGYYFCQKDINNVFVVSTTVAERFLKSKVGYYVTDISKSFDTKDLQLLDVKYSGGEELYIRYCTEQELAVNKFESTLMLEKPFVTGADNENVRTAVGELPFLVAKEVVCDEITSSNLEKYGLNNPTLVTINGTVDVSLNQVNGQVNEFYNPSAKKGTKIDVKSDYYIGATLDSYTYIMYDDYKIIYAVDKSVFDFLNKDAGYFCQSLVAIKALKDLDQIIIEKDDKKYDIKVWTETKDDATIYFSSYKNQPLEGSSLQDLYFIIIGVVQYGLAEDPKTDPILKITLCGKDNQDTVVEFLPMDNGLYAFCRVNGSGKFKVLPTQLDKIMAATELFIAGKPIAK